MENSAGESRGKMQEMNILYLATCLDGDGNERETWKNRERSHIANVRFFKAVTAK